MKHYLTRQVAQNLFANPKRIYAENNVWPEENQLTSQVGRSRDAYSKIMLDSVDEAIALINIHDHSIISANRSFCNKYGDDVVGKPCYFVTHQKTTPCKDDHCRCPLAETLKTKKTSKINHQHVDHNGEVSHANITSYPIFDDQGEVIHIAHVERDVSAQRQYEEELRKAKEMSEAANKTKSLFLANMSHEIRTPMNAVMGLTDLALEMSVDKEQEKYLKMIKTSAHILLDLINGILDLSKIEAGQIEVEHKSFGLREALEESISLLEVNAKAKGLVLCLDLPFNKKTEVIGDSLRLRQIVTNLVTNAIKFTESGYVRLQVDVEAESTENISLLFSVKDTGVGIPENEQAQVFEAFKQVAGGRAGLEGTGLGLSIVKKLVGLMGGDVWLESEVGEGTTFYFSLSFAKSENIQLAKPKLSQQPAFLYSVKNPVLVVSSSKAEQRLLKDILKDWGLLCHTVEKDREAYERLITAQDGRFPYSLIILGKTDFSLRQSKAFQFNREECRIPIVRIVDGGAEYFCERCHNYGVNFCLSGPLCINDLQESIEGVFSGERCSMKMELECAPVTPPPIAITPMNVLLAEDNGFNAILAQTLLEKMGHNVLVVETGVDVLKAVCEKSFDVVLMDVEMPEMDGLRATNVLRCCEQGGKPEMSEYSQLIERLRPVVKGKHTPVVAMTANAMDGDMEKCLEAGMDDYIAKPFQPEDFVRVLERFQPPRNKDRKIDFKNDQVNEGGRQKICPLQIEKFLIAKYNLESEVAHNLTNGIGPAIKSNLAKIQQALGAQDNALMKLAVHSIKGSLLHVGLTDFAEQAQKIETALCCEEADSDFYEQIAHLSTVLHPLITMQKVEEKAQEN